MPVGTLRSLASRISSGAQLRLTSLYMFAHAHHFNSVLYVILQQHMHRIIIIIFITIMPRLFEGIRARAPLHVSRVKCHQTGMRRTMAPGPGHACTYAV